MPLFILLNGWWHHHLTLLSHLFHLKHTQNRGPIVYRQNRALWNNVPDPSRSSLARASPLHTLSQQRAPSIEHVAMVLNTAAQTIFILPSLKVSHVSEEKTEAGHKRRVGM